MKKFEHVVGRAIEMIIKFLALTAITAQLLVVLFVLISGVPELSYDMLSPKNAEQSGSLLPALVNTLELVALTLIFCVPTGTAAAIYICEYSNKRFARAVETAADTLAGLPSVVFGLFGMLCFAISLRLGYSLLSGALTLAVMLLPLSIKTAIQGIKSVPRELREAARGLGAGKAVLIFRVLLPNSKNTIFSGVMLAAGRIFGETAALLFTAGTVSGFAAPGDSGRTLAVELYCMASEGASLGRAYASAALLLIMTALMSVAARLVEGGSKNNKACNKEFKRGI